MAKRGYKLQEFVAHSAGINCLNIGKKTCRLFITGGDDHKVNLWAIGKPTSLMSLSGHTSPIETVTFDSTEVFVLAGASTGVIKLWDLEEAKMVRTVSGHRSNCSAVEFHPFGEFFASGSMDANLKIWDIRKKGCIHTYMGHTQGISTIKFTPDGRWVVSGGFDNVVKVWDLTAGKLLHDFKFHEGHIRSLDFHPLEFLLATGSADRTVKFWDLETFELIGSTRPETAGVRVITFHPDGRTLFSGLDESLKVYSWEPVIRHDAVDMGWSTLGDQCIQDGKLLGCSYYQNSVGVWVADISLIEPYGSVSIPEQHDFTELKSHLMSKSSLSSEDEGFGLRTSALRFLPSDETKEIKNIYVDTSGGKPATPPKSETLSSPKVVLQLDSKDISNVSSQKQSPTIRFQTKSNEKTPDKSLVVPVFVPRDSPDSVKDLTDSAKESITFSRTKRGMLLKPAHIRRPSNSKIDLERLPVAVESGTFSSATSVLDIAPDASIKTRIVHEEVIKESSNEKHSNIRSATDMFETDISPKTPEQGKSNDSVDSSKEMSSVKFVNGVAVVSGRTRTLVEKFERREQVNCNEVQATDMSSCTPETDKAAPLQEGEPQISGRDFATANERDVAEDLMQSHDVFLSSLRSRLTKLQVVRHFWERRDLKGAINAMTKLPDHSVQADVVSVLIEKMDILTLDLFSCLLPVLVGLLDSKIERHVGVSLAMLVKLVAVFGPVIRSTVSAPPAVGVDLQAEQRRQCCNQCLLQLQKIQGIIPLFIRRGGLLAKSAMELNLVLQQS